MATAVRKAAETALARLPARSPLSPLHPSSPLFPDGIVSPLWVRRHREQVPAVYTAFIALTQPHGRFRFPGSLAPEPMGPEPLVIDGENEEAMLLALKRADEQVIAFVSRAQTFLAERGIRLCTVLLTSHDMLRDPMIEARVAYIRRNANLDQKASVYLFAPEPNGTPPTTAAQANDDSTPTAQGQAQVQAQVDAAQAFVTTLQAGQFGFALDYYREHVRRTRRKRARYPPPPSVWAPVAAAVEWQYTYSHGLEPARTETGLSDPQNPATGTGVALPPNVPAPHPLSRSGWNVRLEFKLGVFSEMGGDLEGALQHYVTAYDELASPLCMGSTADFPPRTKRWAEAKMLADTLNIRVIRLLLYQYVVQATQAAVTHTVPNASPLAQAMTRFHRHIQRFSELSAGWGIGDTTFEYWSWRAKQERLLADLLAGATTLGPGNPMPLIPPTHAPPIPSNLLPSPQSNLQLTSVGALRPPSATIMGEGSVPMFTVPPHAGYLYYRAALCVAERVKRYHRYLQEQGDRQDTHPAVTHERTVDHMALLNEIFVLATKAYDVAGDQRTSLFMRYRWASAAYEMGFYPQAYQILVQDGLLQAYDQAHQDFRTIVVNLHRMAADCARRTDDAHIELLSSLKSLALEFDRPTWDRVQVLLYRDPATTAMLELVSGFEASMAVGLVQASAVFGRTSQSALSSTGVQILLRWSAPASHDQTLDQAEPLSLTAARVYLHAEQDDGMSLPSSGEQQPVLVLTHSPDSPTDLIHLGLVDDHSTTNAQANLMLSPSQPAVWDFTLRTSRPAHLSVGRIELDVGTGDDLRARFTIHPERASQRLEPEGGMNFWPVPPPPSQRPLLPPGTISQPTQLRWYLCPPNSKPLKSLQLPFRTTHANYLHVRPPQYAVRAERAESEGTQEHVVAYLNERITIPLTVTNDEDQPMEIWISLDSLHPRSAVQGSTTEPDAIELVVGPEEMVQSVAVPEGALPLWYIGVLGAKSARSVSASFQATSLPGVLRKLTMRIVAQPPSTTKATAAEAEAKHPSVPVPNPAASTSSSTVDVAVEQPLILSARVDRQRPLAHGTELQLRCDVRLNIQFAPRGSDQLVLARVEAQPWPKLTQLVQSTELIGTEYLLHESWSGDDTVELVLSALVRPPSNDSSITTERKIRLTLAWHRSGRHDNETKQVFLLDIGSSLASVPPLFATVDSQPVAGSHGMRTSKATVKVYNTSDVVGSELALQARAGHEDDHDPERTPAPGMESISHAPEAVFIAGPEVQGQHTLLPGSSTEFDLASVASLDRGSWPDRPTPLLLTISAPAWTVGKGAAADTDSDPVPLPIPTYSASGVDTPWAPALKLVNRASVALER